MGYCSDDISARIRRPLQVGALATTAGLVDPLGVLELVLRATMSNPKLLVTLLETVTRAARHQLENVLDDGPSFY
jgi:hypothetical protein